MDTFVNVGFAPDMVFVKGETTPGISRESFESYLQADMERQIERKMDETMRQVNQVVKTWNNPIRNRYLATLVANEAVKRDLTEPVSWRCEYCKGFRDARLWICPGCQAPRSD